MNDIASIRNTGPLEPLGAAVGVVAALVSARAGEADFFFGGKKKFYQEARAGKVKANQGTDQL
jgi:hypothetical protein